MSNVWAVFLNVKVHQRYINVEKKTEMLAQLQPCEIIKHAVPYVSEMSLLIIFLVLLWPIVYPFQGILFDVTGATVEHINTLVKTVTKI